LSEYWFVLRRQVELEDISTVTVTPRAAPPWFSSGPDGYNPFGPWIGRQPFFPRSQVRPPPPPERQVSARDTGASRQTPYGTGGEWASSLLQFPVDPELRHSTHAANSVRASSRSEPPRRSRGMAPVSRAHPLEARNSTHGARRTI